MSICSFLSRLVPRVGTLNGGSPWSHRRSLRSALTVAVLSAVQGYCRWALAVALSASACAKLLSGYDSIYWIPMPLYYAMAGIEVAIAVGLSCSSVTRIPAVLAVALAVSGMVAGFMTDRPCGCFGGVLNQQKDLRTLIGAAVGLLACITLIRPTLGGARGKGRKPLRS